MRVLAPDYTVISEKESAKLTTDLGYFIDFHIHTNISYDILAPSGDHEWTYPPAVVNCIGSLNVPFSRSIASIM